MSNIKGISSPLKRAKGLGSAHDGLHHWIVQRITAIALIPLTIWFVVSLIQLSGSDYAQAVAFFKSPLNAVLMAGVIIAAFWHAALGLQVVIEDYVHCNVKKISALLVVKIGCYGLAIAGVLAIAKLNLG